MTGLLEKAKDNVQKVYEAGKKAEHDTFWDAYQKNGVRTGYNNAFQGSFWTEANFKPKYDMKPKNAQQMFADSSIKDLKGILEECGVKLDFSQTTNTSYIFQYSAVTHLGVVEFTSASTILAFQSASKLVWVDKLKLKDDGSQTFHKTNSFGYMGVLEHMPIEGTIGQPNFNVQHSTKLDKESLTSIINALSTTTTGLTVTLSKVAVNKAFGINVNDETTWTDEWNTLRNSKSNWIIDMV